MNSKSKGDIAEAVFIAECLKKGYQVSTPFGDNAPYDCIVDTGSGLYKVQVKGRTPIRSGSILQMPVQTINNNISKEVYSYCDFVDWIVIVNLDDYKTYKVETAEIQANSAISLRLLPTKNNQEKGVVLAEDYIF